LQDIESHIDEIVQRLVTQCIKEQRNKYKQDRQRESTATNEASPKTRRGSVKALFGKGMFGKRSEATTKTTPPSGAYHPEAEDTDDSIQSPSASREWGTEQGIDGDLFLDESSIVETTEEIISDTRLVNEKDRARVHEIICCSVRKAIESERNNRRPEASPKAEGNENRVL